MGLTIAEWCNNPEGPEPSAPSPEDDAIAEIRRLGISGLLSSALVRNARHVLSQGHIIGLTAESAPKLHGILSAYVARLDAKP